jgi:hypothetical protein
MDADDFRRRMRANESARGSEERADRDLEVKIQREMPGMRARVRKSIDLGLREAYDETDASHTFTYLEIGEFPTYGQATAAAMRAAREAIPDLERRGFKAKVVRSDSQRKEIGPGPAMTTGAGFRMHTPFTSEPVTSVMIRVDWD